MGTYTYQCKQCEHEFSNFSKMSDREVPLSEPCPECKETGHVIQTIKSVNVGDPVVLGKERLPQKFKEGVLSKVKKMPGASQRESKFN